MPSLFLLLIFAILTVVAIIFAVKWLQMISVVGFLIAFGFEARS